MTNSIETKIKLNAIFIYLLVAITCGGGFLYFYISWRNLHTKKQSVELYNNELAKVNELVTAINKAQAEVNLFVTTERRIHLKQFQEQVKEVGIRIDSIKNSERDLGVDTILMEITQLLNRKEQSIISLTRQFTLRNPIDSLSETLSSFYSSADHVADSIPEQIPEPPVTPRKRSLWKRLFSSSEDTPPETIAQVDTVQTAKRDTLPINQIIQQTRINYDQHISAIENQFISVVLADQYISSRISELLTMLYNQIIHLRMDDIRESEILLRANNTRAIIVGSVALILILISLILILKNVSKGYSARKALEQANERTRQLMESRHKLLLSVSHDVKTPLNSMLGYIDIYKRNGHLTDDEVAPVYSSGNHIQALLYNLLEFSGLEKGSVTLAPRDFNLYHLCKEVCEMFTPLAAKKSLKFKYINNFPENTILFSDSLKIKQIVANILSNAIKYTTEGNILFEVDYINGFLQFRITDTGVGIPAGKQNDLFKPFTRVDENSTLDEGSGFGLFVVKGLVDLFEGEIDFKSEQGKGTQVTVKLPAHEGEKSKSTAQSKHVLLIDDDDVFLDMLSRLCRELGHEVIRCKNRNELEKELMKANTFDCVLTDMEMGNFTGKQVFEMIRKWNSKTPVILITGRTDLDINHILSEGFADYLTKPITVDQLHSIIGGNPDYNISNDLESLLGHDKESIQEVVEGFLMSSVNNIILLRKAIENKDFNEAQHICHKMAPMFMQIKAPENIILVLKHADSLRGKIPPDDIWNEINEVTGLIESYLVALQEKYFPD